jgi:uncharacterized protein YjdB
MTNTLLKKSKTYAILFALLSSPFSISHAAISYALDITAHVQDIGDIKGYRGWMIGTEGQSKRLELINIRRGSSSAYGGPGGSPLNGTIQYKCHIANRGDTDWLNEGTDCGTRGEALQLEGLEVRVLGQPTRISLRCHVQNIGNLTTVGDDSSGYCGTKGQSLRLESIHLDIESR